ncbi:MAG: zinc-ribbon domain-containing protein [Bacteroidetes bacterium]|nr:zinc-ribbon domain-containing protein [Bacteroidota bacterium]
MKPKLPETRPELVKEWHPTKNQGLSVGTLTTFSNVRVWWRCKESHEWVARIADRSAGQGCPYCAGQRVCQANCLSTVNPSLALEWAPTRNGSLTPSEVLPGSNKKVWWCCSAGHEWEATINSRSNGRKCPYCSGRLSASDTSLPTTNPNLVTEWHPTKNGTLTPFEVTTSSHKKVWWLCTKGHEWETCVFNRAKGHGCPYCSGTKASPENCFATLNPHLVPEWHPTKNGDLTPYMVTRASRKKVWWLCPEGHEWKARVSTRARGHGCHTCMTGPVSEVSQRWLDSLGVPAEHREVPIKLTGREHPFRIDGFDPETLTVYEFLGDFWHGNPARFDPQEVNPVNKETFGALHKKTIRRLELLRKEGYNVVFIWEYDFRNQFP